MLTPQKLYAKILPHALGAFAQKNGSDIESTKQSARQLSELVVRSCMELGIIGGPSDAQVGGEVPVAGSNLPFAPAALPGIPSFASSSPAGPGAAAIVPAGTPGAPVRHYNHLPQVGTQQAPPQTPLLAPLAGAPVGGQQLVPPAGPGYAPPEPSGAGVQHQVTHAETPKNPSAFGTTGVINQPEQRPSEQQVIVAPGNERMIPAVGGSGTMVVPERIGH